MDEQQLINRMLRGEQRAFDEFFDAFAARLGAFAARRSALDAAAIEDVVQTTMINAMRSLESFRGGSTLFTWLCQICRNQLVDARRKAARRPQTRSLEHLQEEGQSARIVQLTDFRDPLDECAADSERGAVRRAINRLPPHYARILELRFGDELTLPEIARVLGISESAAESQLVRARHAFRAEWQGVAATGEAS
ncbi:MAG TPA: RNA polymerase sigma factor [Steroidobacteraceae bacterium]|nr:RNA polymerase sigma factor [Steroidobacteraceae bacterium]